MLKRKNTTLPSKKKKGQSTIEYVLLVTAVVVVIIAFTQGPFREAYNATLVRGTNMMTNFGLRLQQSYPNK